MDFSKIKKEISMFLSSEEAKVLKKDIVKLGLTASAIAAIIAQAQDTQAQVPHSDSHTDGHSDGHNDAHSDGHNDAHTDSHSDAHSDAHSNTSHNQANAIHSSYPVYDAPNKRGGHSSSMLHNNF